MTYGNIDKEKSIKTYFVNSANWECCVKADNPQEAATLAVKDIYKNDNQMKISPTIMVSDLSKFSESAKILSNAGLHDLSRDLEGIINSIQNES